MKKSQTVLEVVLGFLVMLSLFFGIMGTWAWANRQIAKRQPPFNNSRVEAGTPNRTVGSGGSKNIAWPKYNTETLEESDVHF